MNCQEFDEIWNELLDAETAERHRADHAAAPHGLSTADALDSARHHAVTCPRCAMAQSRNEVLRRALKSWTENRGARPDRALVDRIVSTAGLPSRPVFRSRTAAYVAAAALAVAACLILAIGPWGWRLDPVGKAPLAETVQPAPGHVHDRLLSHALASATDATLDLARTTSGPAARLGRQVIEAATQAEPSAVMKSAADQSAGDGGYGLAALPSVLRDLPESPPGADWLQTVGDGLADSIRPLSDSARHAFGFLLAPSFGKTGNPIISPASKGA